MICIHNSWCYNLGTQPLNKAILSLRPAYIVGGEGFKKLCYKNHVIDMTLLMTLFIAYIKQGKAKTAILGTSHIIRKILQCEAWAVRITAGSREVTGRKGLWQETYISYINNHHHHKHQGLNPLIRPVSTFTAARTNASSVFQLFSFLVVCSGMISKGFGFVAFFASVKASCVCIHLSCLVCL